MADTYKVLYQGQLSTSSGAVYTVPSGTQAIVKTMRVVNTNTASGASISLWHLPSGVSTTGNAYAILPSTTIDAGGFAEFEGTMTMEAGTKLAALAGLATSITLTIYGLEIS